MNHSSSLFLLVLLSLLPVGNRDSFAQSIEEMMYQNQQQQMMLQQQMNSHMQGTQMQAEAALQNYIEQDRERLEAERQQYIQSTGIQISLEQYARSKVMEEAARRNAAMAPPSNPMFEQQKRMFEAGQQAHQQRQQQYDAYNNNWAQGQQQIDSNNQAWMQNQRQIDSNHNRFIQQGIQGNQYYRNTETGQVAELPFAGAPGVYQNSNDDTWISNSMGQYNQVSPQGLPQEMESYEPEYYE